MTKVGCAGILVEDTFCGPMTALPPEGQLLALDSMPVKVGGCAANVAIDLAKQGISTEVIGCVGQDGSAEIIRSKLSAFGIGITQVRAVSSYPTSKTVILLVKGSDRRYLHVFGANRSFTVGQISQAWLESLGVFYLGGLFALPGLDIGELRELLAFCRSRKILTVVDVVVPQDFSQGEAVRQILPHIDYFLPNQDEARLITGEDDLRAQLRALRAAKANTVVITQGHAGAVAMRHSQCWQCGIYPADVIDPSGSGDAFTAGIITGLVRGYDMPTTLRYASALGASATRAIGTTDGVFTEREAEAFIVANQLPVKSEPL